MKNNLELRQAVKSRKVKVLPTFSSNQTVVSVVQTEISFSDNSLFLFSSDNKFRIGTQSIVSNKVFSYFIYIIIFINTVFLAFETYDLLQYIHTYSNYAFVAIYTLECLLKIIAYGFIIGDYTYLRNPWNWLDLLVVIFGLISFLPPINSNLLAMRLLRFILPLKLLPIIPGMKLFIISLFNSLKDLLIVLLVLLVLIFVFAFIGLSIFPRSFYNHCRSNTPNEEGFYPIIAGYELSLCGGENKCPEGSLCVNSYQLYPQFITKVDINNEINYKEFNYGITNFDHILEGLLIVLMTTTGEGWTNLMSLLMDGYNYYASFIYFIVCLIINYYFMVNLAISVLIYNLDYYSQTELIQEELQFSNSKNSSSNRNLKHHYIKLRLIKGNMENSNTATMKKKYRRKYMQIKDQETTKVKESIFSRLLNKVKNIKFFEKIYRKTAYHHNCTSGFICYAIYKQPLVQLIFYLCICLNTLLLLLERYNSGPTEYGVFELINLILVLVYIFELVLNIMGNGIKSFFKNWLNILDLIVVIIGIIDLIIFTTYFETDENQRTVISRIFRIFRLLRIVRLFPNNLYFQVIFRSLFDTIKGMMYYIMLLIIFIYTYALLGFGLFNASMQDLYLNFCTFQNSLLTVFNIILGDHWDKIYIEAYHSKLNSKVGVVIYFITLIVFGNLILLNILIAYLIEHFQRSKKLFEKNLTVKEYINSIHKYWYSHHLKQIRKSNILKRSNLFQTNKVKQVGRYYLKLRNLELLEEGTICFIQKNTIDFNQNVRKCYLKNYRSVEREFIFDVNKHRIEFSNKLINDNDENNNGNSNNDNDFNDDEPFNVMHDTTLQFYDFYDTDYYLDPKMKKYNTENNEELMYAMRSHTLNSPFKRHHLVLSSTTFTKEFQGNNNDRIKSPHLQRLLNDRKTNNLRNSENLDNKVRMKSNKSNFSNIDNEDDNEGINSKSIIVNSHNSNYNLGLYEDNEDIKLAKQNDNINNKDVDILIDNNDYDGNNANVELNSSKNKKGLFHTSITTKSMGYFKQIKTLIANKTASRQYSQINKVNNNDENHFKHLSIIKSNQTDIKRIEQLKRTWNYMKNSSLFIFHTDSSFRQFTRLISQRVEFHIIVLVCIIGNVITISLDTNWIDENSKGYKSVKYLNIIFLILFIIEAVIKIISDDFIYKSPDELKNTQIIRSINQKSVKQNYKFIKYKEEKAYILDFINCVDFICIILGFVDLFLPSTILLSIRTLRIIRLIRPFSLLARNEKFNLMNQIFSEAAPSIGNAFNASLMFIIIYSLLGVNLFKNNLRYYCTKHGYFIDTECKNNGGYWVYNNENYSNFLLAFKSTFIIMIKENWAEIMIKSGYILNSHWVYLYYIVYLIIGNIFMLNIFKAVIAQEYSYIKKNKEKFKLLSDPEKDWIYLQKIMLRYRPDIAMKCKYDSNNLHGFLKTIEQFVTSTLFAIIINSFICCSFVLMLIQYIDESDLYRKTLQYIMFGLIVLFILELIIKIIALRMRFLYSISNIIDSLFILISAIVGILTLVNPDDYQLEEGIILALRIFHVLKMVHYFSSNAKIRSVLGTLLTFFFSVANIGLLYIIILLIYGNLGMSVFNAVPYREVLNHNINFKNFLSTSILLFKVMTNQDWNKLMNELAYHDCRDVNSDEYKSDYYCIEFNVTCYDSDITSNSDNNDQKDSCGTNFSYLYFISYMIICPILLMSLCIAMTIEGFKDSMEENECIISKAYMRKFVSLWIDYDVKDLKLIKPYELVLILKELHPPIGLNYDRSSTMNPFKMKRERERITALKKVNAFDLKRSKTALSLYASKNQKFFTNDIEVFTITDKLNLTMFSLVNKENNNNDANDNNNNKNKEEANKSENTFLKKRDESIPQKQEYYIHFVDACIALSRLGISKTESIPFDQLRMDMVNPFMEKYWKNEFKTEKKIVEHYYADDIKQSTNKIGKYLASLFVFNRGIKQWVEKGRKRVAMRKSMQMNNANTNNKKNNESILIDELKFNKEVDNNYDDILIDDKALNIEINNDNKKYTQKNNTIIEVQENADITSKNTIRQSNEK